jgi:hypothetical protein|tara:strand:- start:235 stop:504 length:270 start_codon:yes stop_codon:yes gene_type:complete
MAENEIDHVKRVMSLLGVSTVLVSKADVQSETIYVDGKLVYDGPDFSEARSYWENKPFVICNQDEEDEWECSSREGNFFPDYLIEEKVI